MVVQNGVLFQSDIQSLPCVNRGKVRDTYEVDGDRLLIIATDRISAFDVVFDDPIPGKGWVLNGMSEFWFRKFDSLVLNHTTGINPETVVKGDAERAQVCGRAMIVKKLNPLPIEAIVRGYLIGSGWKDYQQTGKVCDIPLPAGMRQAEQLPGMLFTPSTKAVAGEHDKNISFEEVVELVGEDIAVQVRDMSKLLYSTAIYYALARGIVIADTKFEFGTDEKGKVYLIDEVLTPDSSRFWPADQYRIGTSPPSFDKQFVRDYLEGLGWDKQPPAPSLPEDVIGRTAEKYREAYRRLIR